MYGLSSSPDHTLTAATPPGRSTRCISSDRDGLVGDELQTLLTQQRIELVGCEGQFGCIGDTPLHRSTRNRMTLCLDQHPFVEVRRHDLTVSTDDGRGDASHDAGAAGHVEHTPPRLQPRVGHQIGSPRFEPRRHEPLILLSRRPGHLPPLLLCHRHSVSHRGVVGSTDNLRRVRIRSRPVWKNAQPPHTARLSAQRSRPRHLVMAHYRATPDTTDGAKSAFLPDTAGQYGIL